MSALKDSVLDQAKRHVRVIFVDKATAKWWNGRMRDDDVRTFTGWYWIKGADEAGPFRSMSAAWRDAYYRFVLHQKPRGVKR